MICYHCGFDVPLDRKPGRQDTCPQCDAYLHCCRNCRFYEVKAHHQCREPQAEWVSAKEMGNFCDYFEAKTDGKQVTSDSRTNDARIKLEDLFKK